MGLSLVPQVHGGALLSGGKPGNPGHNQHTARQRAAAVRGGLVTELEGAAKDLSALLETGLRVSESVTRVSSSGGCPTGRLLRRRGQPSATGKTLTCSVVHGTARAAFELFLTFG